MPGVKPGTPIVLKERSSIDTGKDTEKRQETAQIILEMWPDEKQKIAEEAGRSRTHVDNTLESHFEPLLEEHQYATHHEQIGDLLEELRNEWTDITQGGGNVPNINPPKSDNPDWVSGYMRGYMDCWDEMRGVETSEA